ncbi:PTB domain-containing engulfment adapter protein 1 isoform X9 [Corythoichthys intestinalis]|uniref:PTB domain-containing engulfment adapter protein 1 isoform X9 n=1 Tax=Corythoichthys intestinalis TaxID=161448 RepID=UPI0025A5DE37|nr:PTB domain-containing engulfment adapter protein 1 isoform X9 [Corythoichthys intestinalis]
MCLGKPFLLSLQTPSFLHAAVVIVPASGQQLKTIRISSFLLFHPSLEARGISQYIREEQRRTFSTMNRAFNRKKEKSWMHTPEALAKHYIAYNAKFLGNTEVEAPKGTEVVKDAVRKLKFQRHIKKSEGQKTPKVELQISIYGVKILDPKTKEVQHNCQLHRISFCADDKTDKRIFTFICKDSESNKHLCYVFDSEKCAEEITLTIGQAFDLAYKKFLESGGKDVETRKQIGSLQKRIQELETENSELKKQLQDLEQQLMIAHVPPAGSISTKPQSTDIFDMVPFSPGTVLVPTQASNGCPTTPTILSSNIGKDLFGAEPFDPFTCGSADFPPDIQSKLDEMQRQRWRGSKWD